MKKYIYAMFLLLPFAFSAHPVNAQDSIGTKKINGQVFIQYKVGKGEGLNAICRKYNVKKEDVLAANPGMKETLNLGQIILIPSTAVAQTPPQKVQAKPVSVNETHAEADADKQAEHIPTDAKKRPDSYTVKAGETMYKICTLFNVSEADVRKWNNMTDNNLKEGQVLWLKPMNRASLPPPVLPAKKDSLKNPVAAQASSEPHPMATSVGIKEREENGMARWFLDDEMSGGKLLALHKTAPVGTIIKITNKINGKSVFVRVVGTLPDTDENKNILIKISRTTAEKIGMRDEQAQVKLNYSLE
ncbi:MAG: LysM peptidoglycan-binding domain-containing protein [Bacteroidia bacterium]|nr:LysM peptidoglycan-binding domain-containing protein [Bacteroidia bacterium]